MAPDPRGGFGGSVLPPPSPPPSSELTLVWDQNQFHRLERTLSVFNGLIYLMKRLLHLPEEAINKDIPKCNCFWVPSYDLFASARTAVVSGRSNLPQKSLVNSPFWTKVWTPPINISWIRPCFLKAVWLENIDEQNLQPDTLNDKGHPQATSCKPIYHGKPVICKKNFRSQSAKKHGDYKQNSWYGKLWRSVVQGETIRTESIFVSVEFLIHSEQYANTYMAVLIRCVK